MDFHSSRTLGPVSSLPVLDERWLGSWSRHWGAEELGAEERDALAQQGLLPLFGDGVLLPYRLHVPVDGLLFGLVRRDGCDGGGNLVERPCTVAEDALAHAEDEDAPLDQID